ncbi:S-adenosyl-L-methionine-dependent methyltransferase [Gaertneriomyces semiglobifer]|nr:S-adenosyl-L-methionine-dependent methyltransferase [Gaertneriomyces semiglobifer]
MRTTLRSLESFRRIAYSPSRATFATQSSLPPTQQIFNRLVKKKQRNRSAQHPESPQTDYLKDEVADRVVDRLLDIKRRFSTVVDLGSGAGHIAKFLDKDLVDDLIMYDMSEALLHRDEGTAYEVPVRRIVGNEELLPFEENSLDAVISSLSLHWVNDIPGTLIQIQKALKPDGLFLGAMLGGDTLFELRTSLQLTEIEREGGVSPHVSPMTDSKDVASLLQRAKFNLITIDVDEIQVQYPSMFELMNDLRAMGESNAILARKPYLSRDTMMAAAAAYTELYGEADGSIPATFQIIYMIGWKPDKSQPKPLPRGAGELSLKDLEKVGQQLTRTEDGITIGPPPPVPTPKKD